jgi:hypothetical protein
MNSSGKNTRNPSGSFVAGFHLREEGPGGTPRGAQTGATVRQGW